MNIHEHQAKQILKKFGVKVPKGIYGFTVEEVIEKAKTLKTEKYILKAQIHSGGRGKAGGVKILSNLEELKKTSSELLGKKLITNQTGPEGKIVKRLYVEESSKIEKEFYLSCLVDRTTAKIAFISSDQGGMDIEEVAAKSPNKILTTKVEFNEDCGISVTDKVVITISLLPELGISVPPQASYGCKFTGTFSVKEGGSWKTINPEDFMDGSNYFGVEMILEMVPKSSSHAEVKIKGKGHVGPAEGVFQVNEELTVFHKDIHM